MFPILNKTTIGPGVTRMEIEAPEIAKRAKPGQFLILRIDRTGERVPLTIAGHDTDRGAISIIFQSTGKTTTALAQMNPGESISDVMGPLGHPTRIENFGTVVAIAGGVGVAEILPVVKAMKEAGNTVITIAGARSKELVILEDELKKTSDKLYITTDDGSSGQKGFVSNVLDDLLAKQLHIDLVYAIGPVPMMKAIAGITRTDKIATMVSLNPIMVDGTGMCGSCRVSIGGETKFACVDGPEFDAHQVNWDELSSRLTLFRREEKISLDEHHGECACQKEHQ